MRPAVFLIGMIALFLTPPAGPASGAANTGEPPQIFRAIYPQAPGTLDPQAEPDPAAWPIIMAAYTRLMTLETGSGQAVPATAKTVRVSEDGLKYTFILNEGLTFSDGWPVNSEAMLFSFDRLMSSEVGQRYYPHLTSLEIIGPYTFRLILKQPWPPFLATLALPQSSLISPGLERKPHGYLEHNSLGSGRYEVYDWRDDTIGLRARIDLVSQPQIGFAMFHFESDPRKRYEKMLRHQAHLTVAPALPEGSPPYNYQKKEALSFAVKYAAFNTRRTYTSLEGVRRALRLILTEAFSGRPGHLTGLFPAGMDPGGPAPPGPALDGAAPQEEARRILSGIGAPAGPLTLAVKARDQDTGKDLEIITGALASFGISLNVVFLEGAPGQKILEEGDYDILLDRRRPESSTPEMWLGLFLDSRSSAAANPAFFQSRETDSLIEEITFSLSGRERAAKLIALADLARSAAPYVMLYQTALELVVDPRLAALEPHPMWPEVWPLDLTSLKALSYRSGVNPQGRPPQLEEAQPEADGGTAEAPGGFAVEELN